MATVLGSKIKDARKKKGLSLDQLAVQTGMSKSYIWELENRPANPTKEKLSKLAEALDVTAAYFTHDETELDGDVFKDVLFRKFNQLSDSDKEKVQQIIDLWGKKQ